MKIVKQEILDSITELHSQGLKDSEIGKILNKTGNNIQWLRTKHLNLPANQPKMAYKNSLDRRKGYIIRNIKFSAKRRKIYFDLKYSDLELPIYCPLLNIKLDYDSKFNGNSFDRATVDRIDNNKGYIKGNVIILSKLANAMKNEASFDQLEIFSNNILKLTSYLKNQGALGSITDIFPGIELKT